MPHSMTAFAQQRAQGAWGNASIELRSVNHRYLDLNFRLPESLRELEIPLRDRLRARLQRGKVDCIVRFQPSQETAAALSLNTTLMQSLLQAVQNIEQQHRSLQPATAIDILRWPGMVQESDCDYTQAHQAILQLVDTTLDDFIAARAREGAALAQVLHQKTEEVRRIVSDIAPRTAEIVAHQRQKYQERIAEFAIKLDEARLEQEIVLLAQRIDVAEELDRLNTHLNEVDRALRHDQGVGRRLDFLMQELNREANTLGSKSIDATMTQASVAIKVLIEQMREQIQNIE